MPHRRFLLHMILGLALLLISISVINCRDDVVTPPPDSSDSTVVPKSPREYAWTIDTLAYPGSFQTLMTKIWACSSENVYVVGHNDQNRGKMYHYDGRIWDAVKLTATVGGPILGTIDLKAIYGFSASNIIAVGEVLYTNFTPPPNILDSSLILHYDGVTWRKAPISLGRGLNSVWGASPTDVWAGGGKGTLYHYDGDSWTRWSMPDTVRFRSIAGLSSNDVYALGYNLDSVGLSSNYLFHWNGSAWTLLEGFKENSGVNDLFGERELIAVEGRLYSAGAGIFVRNSSTWTRMVGSQSEPFLNLGAASSNNIIGVGYYGKAYHFNGSNWAALASIGYNDLQYFACWSTTTETFVVGIDAGGNKTYVLHGK